MYNQSSTYPNLQSDMLMAFQKSIPFCFIDLNNLINNTSLKDLHALMPQLIENLFNFTGSTSDESNFGLIFSKQPTHFDACISFFSLDSPLISTLMQLTNQNNYPFQYEFPISCLPTNMQTELSSGQTPELMKIRFRPFLLNQSGDSIPVDPFEHFLLHFSYYLTNPHNFKVTHALKFNYGKVQWTYASIFNQYLEVFFTTKSNFIPPKITPQYNHPGRGLYRQFTHINGGSSGGSGGFDDNYSAYNVFTNKIPPYSLHQQQHPPSYNSSQQQHIIDNNFFSTKRLFQQPNNTLDYFNKSLNTQQQQHKSPQKISKMINIDKEMMAVLRQTSPTNLPNSPPHHLNPLLNEIQSRPVFYSELFLNIIASFMLDSPTNDQVYAYRTTKVEEQYQLLRILVKKLHSFHNSSTQQHPLNTNTDSAHWNHLKLNIWSPWLRTKLFTFLKHHFDSRLLHRPVLEVWLTYIQPWRYENVVGVESRYSLGGRGDGDGGMGEDKTLGSAGKNGLRYLTNKWVGFLGENLPFYTTFLSSFLDSHTHLDLCYQHHLFIVHRVFEVFSIQNLNNDLKKEEIKQQTQLQSIQDSVQLQNANFSTTNTPKYPLQHSITFNQYIYNSNHAHNFSNTTTNHPSTNHPSTFLSSSLDPQNHVTFFSRDLEDRVLILIRNAIQARSKTYDEMMHLMNGKLQRSFITRAYEWVVGDSDADQDKHLHHKHHLLNTLINHLFDFFKIPYSKFEQLSPSLQNLQPTTHHPSSHLPDYEYVSDGSIRVTDLGRYEIISKKKYFDVSFHGDPDTQVVRSFESSTLVRPLTNLSQDLSHMYSSSLSEAVKMGGMRGVVARCLFMPSPPSNHQSPLVKPLSESMMMNGGMDVSGEVVRGNSGEMGRNGEMITGRNGCLNGGEWWTKPRIRLRFMASYSTWWCFLLYIFLIKLATSFTVVTATFVALATVFIFVALVFKYVLNAGRSDDPRSFSKYSEKVKGDDCAAEKKEK